MDIPLRPLATPYILTFLLVTLPLNVASQVPEDILRYPAEIFDDQSSLELLPFALEQNFSLQEAALISQQSLEKSSWYLLYSSTASTLLTFLGMLLLIWTLFLTRQANSAAREAVNVTRDIGVAQTASYLTVDYLEVHASPQAVFTHVHILNFGASPSYGARARVRIRAANTSYPRGRDPYSRWKSINFPDLSPSGKASNFTAFTFIDDRGFFDEHGHPPQTPFSAEITLDWKDIFGRELSGTFTLSGYPDTQRFRQSDSIYHWVPSQTNFIHDHRNSIPPGPN